MKVSVGVDRDGFAVVHVEGKNPKKVAEAYLETRRIISTGQGDSAKSAGIITKPNKKEDKQ